MQAAAFRDRPTRAQAGATALLPVEAPTDEGGASRGGAEMLANRLRKNQKRLRSWLVREDIHCYRVYDADLPEYALAIDRLRRPRSRAGVRASEHGRPGPSPPQAEGRDGGDTGGAGRTGRRRGPESTQAAERARAVPRLDDQGRFFEVTEGGLRFLVNLTDYLDTGLFLDHRITRKMIREAAKGKRFLNLFAYTGSATVYAAAGGATTTTTVDLSPTYLDWARGTCELNGFSGSQAPLPARRLRRLAAVRDGRGRSLRPDLHGRPHLLQLQEHDGRLWTSRRDHALLVRAAARLLSKEGLLLFSTNYRKFKLDPELEQEFEISDITKQTVPARLLTQPQDPQMLQGDATRR